MKEKYKKIILIFFCIVTLFLGVLFVFWTIIPNLQSTFFYKNFRLFTNEQNEKGLLNSQFSFYPNTYVQPRLRYEFMDLLFKAYAGGQNPSKELVLFAKNKLEENTLIEGNYANNFLALGKAYDLLADLYPKEQAQMRLKAESSYKKALELFPGIQSVLYTYSVNLTNQGRIDEALSMIEQAVKEDPRVAESHYYLGVILYNKGGDQNINESLKEMETAFQGGYVGQDNLPRIIYEKMLIHYYDQKNISNLKIVLNRLVYLNESQADTYKKIIKYMDLNKIIPILNLHN